MVTHEGSGVLSLYPNVAGPSVPDFWGPQHIHLYSWT